MVLSEGVFSVSTRSSCAGRYSGVSHRSSVLARRGLLSPKSGWHSSCMGNRTDLPGCCVGLALWGLSHRASGDGKALELGTPRKGAYRSIERRPYRPCIPWPRTRNVAMESWLDGENQTWTGFFDDSQPISRSRTDCYSYGSESVQHGPPSAIAMPNVRHGTPRTRKEL